MKKLILFSFLISIFLTACSKSNNELLFDGMFFSTEFVDSYYEYDIDSPDYGFTSIGGVIYDSPDAGLDNVEIFIHWESYVEMDHFIKTNKDSYGHLEQIYTLSDGTPVFLINWQS